MEEVFSNIKAEITLIEHDTGLVHAYPCCGPISRQDRITVPFTECHGFIPHVSKVPIFLHQVRQVGQGLWQANFATPKEQKPQLVVSNQIAV